DLRAAGHVEPDDRGALASKMGAIRGRTHEQAAGPLRKPSETERLVSPVHREPEAVSIIGQRWRQFAYRDFRAGGRELHRQSALNSDKSIESPTAFSPASLPWR